MDSTQLIVIVVIALAVAGFIAWPLRGARGARAGRRIDPGDGAESAGDGAEASGVDVDRVERRIVEYRDALRRQTVCARCLYANPAASRFCAQCGARLASADAALGAEASTR